MFLVTGDAIASLCLLFQCNMLAIPKLTWRNTGQIAKRSVKAHVVAKSTSYGDIMERNARGNQLLCMRDPAVQNVVIDAVACVFFELMAEVGFANAEMPGEHINRQCRSKVIVNVLKNILHNGVVCQGFTGSLWVVDGII